MNGNIIAVFAVMLLVSEYFSYFSNKIEYNQLWQTSDISSW